MTAAPSSEPSFTPAPNDPTVGKNTERLNELAFAFKQSQALAAALEIDLFTAVSQGAGTIEAAAQACGVEAETADRLLIICKAMGLITEHNGQNINMDDVERFLVRGNRAFFGDYLRFTIDAEYDEWSGFPNNLKNVSAAPPPTKLYEGDLNDPETARKFTMAGYNSSIPLAHRLAKRFDFSRFNRWLDFAGGSGCYAIAACERHEGVQVIVKDHPNVVPVTREFIGNHDLEGRITAEPGNFLDQADYPDDCDLISFITPLHWYLRDDVLRTLGYAFDALPPGGTVLIVGYMLDDKRAGPIDPALYHLYAVQDGHYTGHVPSGPEYCNYLQEVGFEGAQYDWLLPNRLGRIEATKPKG